MTDVTDPITSIKEYGGLKMMYRVGSADEHVLDETFEKDLFLSGAREYRFRPEHVIIDVGAHIGAFAVDTGSRLTSGKLIAVEACSATFEILQKNIELNDLKNVIPVQLALSDHTGEEKLYHDHEYGNWGHTTSKAVSLSFETVPTDTLANVMKAHQITQCDLLKMNCEGAEFKILLSADTATLHQIGTMIVLYHTDLAEGHEREELSDRLKEAGFYVKFRCESSDRGWLIATRKDLPKPPLRMLFIGSAIKETLSPGTSAGLHELAHSISGNGVEAYFITQGMHPGIEPYQVVKYPSEGFEYFGLNFRDDASYQLVEEKFQQALHGFILGEKIDHIHIDSPAGWPVSLIGLGPVLGVPTSIVLDDVSLLCPQITAKIEDIAAASDVDDLMNRCTENYLKAHFQGGSAMPRPEEYQRYLKDRIELVRELLLTVPRIFVTSKSLEELYIRCGLLRPGQAEQYPSALVDGTGEDIKDKLAAAHIELAWSMLG